MIYVGSRGHHAFISPPMKEIEFTELIERLHAEKGVNVENTMRIFVDR
jgi:hypothetical protein